MKKISIIIISLVFVLFSCNNSENTDTKQKNKVAEIISSSSHKDKKYDIEKGIIKYNMEAAMGIQTKTTLSFKDFGKIESFVTKMELMGKKIKIKSIRTKEYTYQIDTAKNIAIKSKTIQENADLDPENLDFSNIPSDIRKKYKIHEDGYENVAGKKCKVFKLQINNNPAIYYIWNNIPLKWQISNNGLAVYMEALEVIENPTFTNEFDIPKNITTK